MREIIKATVENRKQENQQYLKDIEKIYSLCRDKAMKLNLNISNYPETLEELIK
jgi:hypothetical protein